MNRNSLLVALGVVFCAQLSPAQDLWREGRNVSGLSFYDAHEAEAQLYGKYTSGGFRTLSDGQQLWTAGASAQAETHFKDLVLGGAFSFEQVSGKDMMGSMFIQPGYYPIDVLEYTPGPKLLQTYGIGGSLAWINSSAWVPGVSVRFTGANYSKRKDIRHTTYRQEVEVVPSLLYKGDGWAAGITYSFLKTSEYIQAEQIGSATAESYYAFLDKGLRYGLYQVWDGSGLHLKEAGVDRLPVREITHGMGLQLSLGESLYVQADYFRSLGEVGEKGFDWFRFPGQRVEASLTWALRSSSGTHLLRADYGWGRQENYEGVLEKETSGGVTTPVSYGSNRIFAHRDMSLMPSYRYVGDNGLELGTEISFLFNNNLCTLVYPFLDRDDVFHMVWNCNAKIPLGAFELHAGLLAGGKLGERQHVVDTADEHLGLVTTPLCETTFRTADDEFEDVPRLGGSLALRYNLPVAKNTLYIEAGCDFVQAFQITVLPGSNRQTTHLSLGYSF